MMGNGNETEYGKDIAATRNQNPKDHWEHDPRAAFLNSSSFATIGHIHDSLPIVKMVGLALGSEC